MRGKTKIVPTAAEDGQSAMSDRQPTPPVQLSDRVKTVVQEQRRPRVTVEKLLGTIAETVVSRAVQTVKTAVLPTMLGREQGSEGECLPLTSPESLSSGSLTPHSSGRFNELYPCSFSSQSSSWDPDQLSPTVLDNRVGGESSPLPGQQGKSVDRQEAVLRDCAADIVSLVQQEAELETNRHSSTALAIRLEEGEAARTENSSRLGSLCLTDLEQRLVDPICGIVARADDTLPPPPVPSDPRDSAQIPPCHKASSEAILSMADSPGGQVDSLGHEAERTQTPHSSAAAGRASPPRDNISTEVRQQPRQPSASSSTSYSSSSSGASSVASALTEDMIAGLLYRLSPEPHSPLTALAVDLVDSVLQEVSEDWELSTALEQQCAGKEGLRSHPDSVRAAVSSAPQQLVRNSEDLSSTITSSVMEQLNQAFLGLDRSQSVTSLPPCSPSFEPAEAQELSDTQEDEEQLPASLAMTPTAQANIELRDRMCDEGSSLGEEEQVTKLATLNGLLVRASMDALIPTSVAPVEEHLAADSPGGQVDSLGHEAERTQTPHSSAAAGRASPPRDNISTEVRQQPWQPSASSSTSYSSSSSGASSVASALTEDMIAGLLYRLSPEPHSPLTALAVDLVDSVLQEVSEDWELSTALEQQCAGKEGLRSHPDSVRAAVSSAPQQLVQHSGSPAALRSALSSGSEDLRSAITSSVVEQLNQAFLGLDRSQRVTSPVARELQSRSRVSPPVELEMPSTSLPLCSPSFEPAKAQELSDTQEDEEQLPASLAMTPTADLPTQPGAAGQARGEEPEDLPAGAAEAPRKDKPSKKEHIRHFLCRVSRSFSQLRNVRVSPEPSRPKSI
ncbi:uncharacterized protein LOC136713587 [Amia ocellicauda]|uniref:uncharacterized protein LOC136713587 n=1 Tax=Amia ocellicauda TaxID=2972642 RepID=UPI003463ACCF